jgi:hypothetical protein
VVGLCTFVVLAVGVGVWLVLRTPTYHAPLNGTPSPTIDEARAVSLLTSLQNAVNRDDGPAAARLGATPRARTDLRGVVRNAEDLRVSGFAVRYIDQEGGTAPDGSWAAVVHTQWRFAHFDPADTSLDVRVGFALDDGKLGISGIGGGNHRSPLWLSGPLQVRRSPDTLVLVQGPAAEADRLATLARTAVPQVREVLSSWHGGLVVEVPHSQNGLLRTLDAQPAQYAGIAAVTTTVDGSESRTAPVHVFVNPQVFIPLTREGAQVVLTHETTHVATGAATSPSPTWLVEGFADFVALHANRVPLATAASRIIALVHHGHVPAHLPEAAQFAAGSSHLEARYESAWLACRLLAALGGTGALVHFYQAVDAGHPVAAELHEWFGFGPAALTAKWRTLLSHLPA